jgi:IS30 family transposase
MKYHHLTLDERITLQLYRIQGLCAAECARKLLRHPATISRELRRNRRSDRPEPYSASAAHHAYRRRRQLCRPKRKLLYHGHLMRLCLRMLRKKHSPEQIAGQLKTMFPADRKHYVCHETIYNAIYAVPKGSLRSELLRHLRQANNVRRPRSGGIDRRGAIPEMVNIALRSPEVEARVVPGHWEGDLIKGKNNASAVGTLVERSKGYVMLIKLQDATATEAVRGFSAALNRMPLVVRKTMTYDQGREMAKHLEITQQTGVAIYFCDPHSPWQRPSNENTNGLIRQYLPKGTDLSVYSQAELDEIAFELNSRPRKRFKWKSPIEMMTDFLQNVHNAPELDQ